MSEPSLFHITRFPSHEVAIGDRPLGGKQPIRLQSMTSTSTLDVKATVAQSIRIFQAGADYVRISAPNMEAAHKLADIRRELHAAGFTRPLVADIHFQADVALVAARHVEKVRINPGNYIRGAAKNKIHFTEAETREELERALESIIPLVATCKEYGTAIRIGTNMGSLSPRIVAKYGNTPQGMVMATFEFLQLFQQLDFRNLVVSLKASKPMIMIQAYEGIVEKMLQHNMSYPLHIGITEAGEGENGRIKSALGICTLLNKGIGDTLRVSLTEDPEKEIPFANKLSSVYQLAFTQPDPVLPFNLKKFEKSEKEIPLPMSNQKAIVVERFNPAKAAALNTEVDAESAQKRKPDLYFSRIAEEISAHPDHTFLLPAGLWANLQIPRSYPLEECNTPLESKPTCVAKTRFLQICCNSTRQKFVPAFGKKPGVLIADLGTCDFTGSLTELIAFGQQQGIPVVVKKKFTTAETDDLISHAAILFGSALLEHRIHGLWLEAPRLKEEVSGIAFGFLQSAGIRITRTEFISCPTCARTSFDLQKVLHQVQQSISHLPGLKVAVMGCVVNGPGEMADADFGFVGTATGKLHLYKGKTPIIKNIEPSQAVGKLLEVLRENGIINS